ncbi:MAG: FAD-binding protein [Bdellovibrionaceae bacterium]|nr:FAD-binding protein [Pseudobdellovibrionaceae bacterium]
MSLSFTPAGKLCYLHHQMSQTFRDLKIGLDESLDEQLSWLLPGYSQYRVLRKSVDARRSSAPHWVYTVEVFGPGETPPEIDFSLERISPPAQSPRPLIIGSGPAGLFAAIRLVERGIPCTLLERGSQGGKRIQSINRFWRYGELDLENNVCFGEGGAGLYSDGKLITRIKSPYIPYVMDRLVRFGAPEEIRYLANPHVGSDRIRRVIPKIREYLQANGCEIHFDTKMTRLLTENDRVLGVVAHDGREFRSDHVILATGHSAEDVFDHLRDIGVFMEGKSYALGLRIEHPQTAINKIQYRAAADHPALGAANYKLASHDDQRGIGVYSFCMCPGGYVLSSGTTPDGLVSNGMSNYHRNSPFANAAVVVTVDHDKLFQKELFGGLEFRRRLEKAAFQAVRAAGGTRELPVQKVTDFLTGRLGSALPSSSPSGVVATRLDQLLPDWMVKDLRQALERFDTQMRGFISEEAQFHGVESRTSCPVRITRDTDTLESVSHKGLYPTGEGAGYAGGITSAACDGIRVAEAIATSLSSQSLTRAHV